MAKRLVLKKEEIEIIMILMGENSLPDIAELGEDYAPDGKLAEEMVQKGIFTEDENGRKLHSFVHFIMWNVLKAECVLRSWQQDGTMTFLYFKSDVMILLSKKADSDEYIFYLTPFIPQAVGGFTSCCKPLIERMTGENSEEILEMTAANELTQCSEIPAVLRANGMNEATDEALVFSVRGDIFDRPAYFAAVLQTSSGWLFAQAEDKLVTCSAVNGYGMMSKLSEWIIATHGSCISWSVNHE